MSRNASMAGVALAVTLLLTACAAPTQRTTSSPSAESVAPRTKTLTLTVPREPDAWNTDLTLVTRGGGTSTVGYIGHNKLTVQDDNLEYVAELAAEQLSFERGTWKLNADGTMDTTWLLRPNIKWHDGTPMTSDDLLFSFTVIADPEIPNQVGAPLRLMASATAPDPYTFVVHWSAPYIDADQAPGLTPMPRHILGEIYRTDKAALPIHPWMTTDFVGVGPYRLTRWESGVLMEFVRFDDYYKGKPPLDTVFVRFIADENAAVASLLAGQIDVIPPVGIDLDLAQQVKERWEGTGNRVGGKLSGGLKIIEMQHRAEFARPGGGLNTTPVRQAFYHALDRAQLAEVLTHGNAQAADSWFFPGHPLRPQVESSISPFPYDPARALRLLTDAGWTRASEALVRRDTAERFEVELSGTRDDTKAVAIIANYWRSLGVVVDETPITSDRQADLEQLARSPGAWLTTPRFYQLFTDRYHSRSAPTAATRWTGRNRGGYSNPRVDAVLDQLVRTIPPAERLPLHRELLREQGGDLAVMPLYWEYDPFLHLRGVRGITTGGAWNFVEWDKE